MRKPNREPQPVTQRLWPILAAAGALALLVRGAYLWQIRDAPFFGLRMGDGEAYHLWARRIASGDWLGHDVFYQAPLYPYFLAAIYRVLGESVMTIRLIQAMMGALASILLAWCGVRTFGRWGALAGFGLAVYGPAVFLDSLIDKTALATLLMAVLLWAMCSRRWIPAGLALGLFALARENGLLLAVPLLAWIVLSERWRAAAWFAGACALVLLPVAVRNLAVGGEFLLTTSQFGPNFYIGNHAGASGTYQALVTGHGNAADERADATVLAESPAGRELTAGEVSGYWRRRAMADIAAHPVAWLGLLSRKAAMLINSGEIADTESQDVYATQSWLLRLLSRFDFGVLLALAAFGAVVSAPRWRSLWWLWALIATYSLSVVLFYVLARYRLPLAPPLLLIAAGGVIWRAGTPWRAAVAAAVALALAHLPIVDERTSKAANYLAVAGALSKADSHAEEAAAFYRMALQEDPQFPAAHLGLGTLLARTGHSDEAVAHYRSAIEVWPEYAEAHYNLAAALADGGQMEAAAREYDQAVRLRPEDADTHAALGKTLLALGRVDEAARQYREALRISPQQASSRVGLGVALAQAGHPGEGLQELMAALDTDPQSAAAHNSAGAVLAGMGRLREALVHFESAVRLAPTDEAARRNLEMAQAMLRRR